MATIDYYFFGASPFVYLGHKAFEDTAAKHGCGIAYKPVDIAAVFGNSGAKPLKERPLARQRYRLLELQRAADRRGLPINLAPRHFPVDATLADQAVIALLDEKQDPSAYMFEIFSAVWAREENISDPAVITRYLNACGFDGDAILSAAQGEDVAARRRQNTQEAIAADAVGVPAYVLNGEVFWGQDRIDDLDRALASGRAPFSAAKS
ncbi:2-hydroxychromene-2-carboxylate isomerase [Rhizobium albus]|nr:2-hydroxychromene-2-carboxylate isomerase [Rhizobium albus]